MAAPIGLRDDFDAAALRALAKASRDPDQLRRLLSLAEIYDGGSHGDAARVGGVGLQTVRDRVLRFNAGGPEGLIDPKGSGRPPKLNGGQRRALTRVVESGPIPAAHGVVRWRLADLVQWVWEAFRIRILVQTLSRELRALGYPQAYGEFVSHMSAIDLIMNTGPDAPAILRSSPGPEALQRRQLMPA
jgi:transposase